MSGLMRPRLTSSKRSKFRAVLMALCMAVALVAGLTTASASSASTVPKVVTAVPVQAAAVAAQQPVARQVQPQNVPLAQAAHAVQAAPVKVVALAASSIVNGPGRYYPAGPHLRPTGRPLFLGPYINTLNGVVTTGYCVQSGKVLFLPQTFGGSLTIPGLSPIISQKVSWILSTWGNSSDLVLIQATSLAVKKLADPRVTLDWAWYAGVLPPVIYNTAKVMLARADIYYGSHVITMTHGPAVFVGQPQLGTLFVQSKASGHILPNQPIRLIVTGARSATALPTNTGPSGIVHLRLIKNSLGAITVRAVGTIAQSTRLLVTPPSSQQELVSWYPVPETIVAVMTINNLRAVVPTVSPNCVTNCNGVAPTTLRACNAVGAAPLQHLFYDVNPFNRTVTYRGNIFLRAGQCGALTINVADLHHITATDRYIVDGKWTALVREALDFVVHCEAVPLLIVGFFRPCDATTAPQLTIVFPANRTAHVQFAVVKFGDSSARIVGSTIPGGAEHQVKFAVPRRVPMTILSGTHRADGTERYLTVSSGLTFP